VQRQQLPTESQVLEDEVLPGMESADQPTEEMTERHDHSRNYIGKVRIELCAKSFILQVYDVLARHTRMVKGDSHTPWRSTQCKPHFTKSAVRLAVPQQAFHPLQKALSAAF